MVETNERRIEMNVIEKAKKDVKLIKKYWLKDFKSLLPKNKKPDAEKYLLNYYIDFNQKLFYFDKELESARKSGDLNRYSEIGERFSVLIESEIVNHDPTKKLIDWMVKKYE